MEALDCLMTRRSIRSYTDEPVSDADTETLMRAAMAAPSAGNEQPWHFVLVRDREAMNRIMDVHPYSGMLDHAPLCIAVCAEIALERFEGYWVQDTSAATLNVLLAAHAIGLGAVWLGVHPIESRETGLKRILNLPEGVECLSLIAVGHPAERPEPADRYDAGRVHAEGW
jgi:nitroreductase